MMSTLAYFITADDLHDNLLRQNLMGKLMRSPEGWQRNKAVLSYAHSRTKALLRM